MDFVDEYLEVIKKYTVFSGRATRREYWTFTLIHTVFYYFLFFVSVSIGLTWGNQGVLNTVYGYGVLLPSIGVAIRRMHDVDKSGWFVLVPFYNLYLALQPSDEGENSYGPHPDSAQAEDDSEDDKNDNPLIQ